MPTVPEDEQATVQALLDKLKHAERRLADVPADITSMYQVHQPNWRAAGVSALEHIDAAIIALNEVRATLANRLTPYDQRDNVVPTAARWNPGNSGPGF